MSAGVELNFESTMVCSTLGHILSTPHESKSHLGSKDTAS